MKKNTIRTLATSLAIVGVLVGGGLIYRNWNNSQILKRELEYTYLRSLSELSSSVGSISADLGKGIYAGTPQQLNTISSKLWRQAGTAKAALSALPLGQTGLDGTYKFLSQVGDYAMALSRKALSGTDITPEDEKSLQSLLSYSTKLQEHISKLESQFSDGSIPVSSLLSKYTKENRSKNPSGGDEKTSPSPVDEGMKEMESDLSNMPKLIYDGPFSDHILERKALLIKNEKDVSQADALKKAAVVANVKPNELKFSQLEKSNMPSYCFSGKDLEVGITVQGGFADYMTNGRKVETSKITSEQAIKKAEIYLHDLGIKDMETTYYEIYNNICVINFASMQGNVICYTDLIKVGIALDNGDIVHFDARGYITNHFTRKLPTPKLSAKQAEASVSKNLKIESSRLSLIPSPGENEVLCWEFKCKAKNGQIVLVYVNTATGAEEQILLLIISENGQLAI